MTEPRRRRVRHLALALAALAAVEGGARLYERFGLPDYDYLLDERSLEARLERWLRATRGFERREGVRVEVNSMGFRGPEPRRASPEQVLVACIGNGATHGGPVPDDAAWPARLERLLDERTPAGAVVANLGVDGAAVVYGRRVLLPLALELRPDVVVVAFAGLNEALRSTAGEAEQLERRGPLWDLAHSSGAIRMVEHALYGRRNRRGGEARIPRVTLDEYRRVLEEIVDEVRAARARVVLLSETAPHPPVEGFYDPADLEAVRSVQAEVAERRGVPLVDPAALLGGGEVERWFQDDLVLYDAEANARIAEALAPLVLRAAGAEIAD